MYDGESIKPDGSDGGLSMGILIQNGRVIDAASQTDCIMDIYIKEDKRETSINDKWGKYYLTLNLNDFAEKMMEQCQYFNQSFNKCFKKE